MKLLPYLVGFVVVVVVMVVGSQKDYDGVGTQPIISAINDTGFVVTADQLSESYIVADVANNVNLPSVLSINENYTSIVMKYEVAGAAAGGNAVLTKPNIIDTSNLTRGIIKYVVQAGDSLAGIAAKFDGVTETQIRWSNNMKNGNLSAGQTIYIPPVPGILYTVKNGDTLEGLAEKYESNVEEIVIYNDLETGSLAGGATIILPGGALPEKERPEYVPPVVRPPVGGYSGYVRDLGNRYDRVELYNSSYWMGVTRSGAAGAAGNPGSGGQCTWYAWYWRRVNMAENYWLPGGVIGNAGTWTYMSWSNSFVKNKTPGYGAVVQTSTGSPGHVGVVVGVVQDSHIVMEEMNWGDYPRRYRVFRSKIGWAEALKYNYIHGKW